MVFKVCFLMLSSIWTFKGAPNGRQLAPCVFVG
jgi:hypothetical protein